MTVKIHSSARRSDIATHNDGFLEGVCHVIDELRAAGFIQAADAMMAKLFVPAAPAKPEGRK